MGCHIEPSQPDACPAVRYGTVRTWGRIASSAIRSPAVWFPALVLLGLTLVFRFSDADMTLIRPFSADVGQGGGLYGRWPLLGVTVIHRYGRIAPGEDIVMVAAASAHREAAFAAAEFLMDYLKTRAPFWKQVEKTGGSNWVDAKASDDAAAERWSAARRKHQAAE